MADLAKVYNFPETARQDGQSRCAVADLSRVPAPPEATWVGEREFFEDCLGTQDWERMFSVRKWTVETTSATPPIEVELAGSQLSEGCVAIWIWINADREALTADEAMRLAAILSQAAEELERYRRCWRSHVLVTLAEQQAASSPGGAQ
jgi:hypothetical protein